MTIKRGADRRRRVIVMRLQFHGRKSGRPGRAKTIEKRAIGKQERQIGGKARH
jgi:hypothetical protein